MLRLVEERDDYDESRHAASVSKPPSDEASVSMLELVSDGTGIKVHLSDRHGVIEALRAALGPLLSLPPGLDRMAEALGRRPRPKLPVPLLTPRLSSLWIGLVTPVDAGVARIEVIVAAATRDDDAAGNRNVAVEEEVVDSRAAVHQD